MHLVGLREQAGEEVKLRLVGPENARAFRVADPEDPPPVFVPPFLHVVDLARPTAGPESPVGTRAGVVADQAVALGAQPQDAFPVGAAPGKHDGFAAGGVGAVGAQHATEGIAGGVVAEQAVVGAQHPQVAAAVFEERTLYPHVVGLPEGVVLGAARRQVEPVDAVKIPVPALPPGTDEKVAGGAAVPGGRPGHGLHAQGMGHNPADAAPVGGGPQVVGPVGGQARDEVGFKIEEVAEGRAVVAGGAAPRAEPHEALPVFGRGKNGVAGQAVFGGEGFEGEGRQLGQQGQGHQQEQEAQAARGGNPMVVGGTHGACLPERCRCRGVGWSVGR